MATTPSTDEYEADHIRPVTTIRSLEISASRGNAAAWKKRIEINSKRAFCRICQRRLRGCQNDSQERVVN
jgi:hypothetical protein